MLAPARTVQHHQPAVVKGYETSGRGVGIANEFDGLEGESDELRANIR